MRQKRAKIAAFGTKVLYLTKNWDFSDWGVGTGQFCDTKR